MAKTRKQKEQEVKELQEYLSQMQSAVFADFTFLPVKEIQKLRALLRSQGAVLRVVKKSLFKLALAEQKAPPELAQQIDAFGPLTVAFGLEDELAPAKVLADFKKEHKKLEILGGVLGERVLTREEVINLAKLPSLLQLRGHFVGTLASPLSGLVNVLAGSIRNFIYLLNNLKQQKEEVKA